MPIDLDYEDSNVLLSSLKASKDEEEQKWRKEFKEVVIEKCKCTKEGILNIEIENVSPIQVFSKTVGLERLLLLIKKESESYAEQNGRMFQTTSK